MTGVNNVVICGKVTKCFHHCRYCLMGSYDSPTVSWGDFKTAVESFVSGDRIFAGKEVSFELNNNYDITLDQYKWYVDTARKCGRDGDTLLMGGMRMRSMDEMLSWLGERRDLGLRHIIVSMTGTSEIHDSMNGRKGDLEYLLNVQRAAAKLGLGITQRIFVTKKNLPVIPELCSMLDDICEPELRSVYPLHYKGRAIDMEAERLTDDDLAGIPYGVLQYMWPHELHSEREWTVALRDSNDCFDSNVDVHFRLTPENISAVTKGDHHALVADIVENTEKSYAKIPSVGELCERYGDKDSRRVYEGKRKIMLVWLERFLADNPSVEKEYISRM